MITKLPNGHRESGVTTAYTYDSLNRLKQMGAGKNGTLQANYVYTLGAAGNRLTVAELSGRTVNYGYDSLYRLTSEAITNDPNNHNNTTQYQYDAVGNRQQLVVNGVTANTYSYDADDRLGSDQYDSNGNTIASVGTASTYDFENHLVSKGGVTIVYDGDGNRVSETVAGVTTQYLVDTQNPTGYAQVVDELQNGSVVRKYSWGLDLISKLETGNSKLSFYGFDGHGSVRFLTDSTGAVTDTYDYDAFGNLVSSTGSTPNNYLFAGEQFDPALGLYYNRARYLNTSTGRFWSMDTQEGNGKHPLSLHKYLYDEADPIDHLDRSGHEIDLVSTLTVASVVLVFSSIAFTPTVNSTRVEVHFDKLGSLPIYGDYYHAFMLVFKSGSPPLVFRAGPSVRSNPDELSDTSRDLAGAGYKEQLGFGELTTGGCIDVPWTALTGCDFPQPGNPNDDVAQMKIPVVSLGADTLLVQLTSAAHYIDTLMLPYHPISQNSNSFVHTLIKKAGLGDPSPPVNVPGWDHILY